MANKVMNVRMTQTKQSLIRSFLDLVAKKDFEKITIADITKGAQVNRATFYAHFNDKYELLDHIMGDSASTAILNRTDGEALFNQTDIAQLVLAVCDFYQPPNIQCRTSYIGLVVPQLKEKMIVALESYLSDRLGEMYTDDERKIRVAMGAQAIHEGAIQWATGKINMAKEEVAQKVAQLVMNGMCLEGRKVDQ